MVKCLKCGCEEFMVALDMCSKANFDFDENGVIAITPLDNRIVESKARCANCQEYYDLKDEDTIDSLMNPPVECAKCGNKFKKDELNKDGLCPICAVEEFESDFLASVQDADQTTLIKLLAQAKIDNIGLTKSNEKIQKKLEKAEKLKAKEKEKASKKKKETEVVDIDDNNDNSSDIEISDDKAPTLPDEITEMIGEINGQ